MANEYKLSYTAADINERLGNVSQLSENVDTLQRDSESLKSNVSVMQNDMDGFQTNVNTLQSNVDILNTGVETLQNDIQIKAEIVTLTTAEYEELEANSNTNANALYMITDSEEEIIQSDWNQSDESAVDYIKNKPIIFTGSPDTLTWDGNIEGLDAVPMGDTAQFYRVSDVVLSVDCLASGGRIVLSDDDELVFSSIYVQDNGVSIQISQLVFSVPNDIDNNDGSVIKAGTYFAKFDGIYVTSLTINDYTGFQQEKIAPSYLYQPDWNQVDVNAPDYIKNKPFGRKPNEIIVENLEVEPSPGDSSYNNANGEATSSISEITNAFNCEFELGCQYKVTYNDTDYYVEAINDGYGSIALGAYSYWELNEEVPFRLVNNYNGYYDTYSFYGEILGNSNDTCTFSIVKITGNIKTIDDIFISDTIARTTYVDEKIASITGNNLVLITVEDIDEICGASIFGINEVMY